MDAFTYIREKLPLTLRKNEKDDDTLIGLPYPYTVPCADGIFNELYYWDTYFTNKALFVVGNSQQAKYNVLDIFVSDRKVRLYAERQQNVLFKAQSTALCRTHGRRRLQSDG